MNIYAWLLIAWFGYSVIYNIANMGKPRQASTPGVVATATVLLAGFMWLVVLAATT